MKILTVSDTIQRRLYSSRLKEEFNDIDLILSCGDLPFYYLEFLVSMLNVPLYYVFGNHYNTPMITNNGKEVTSPGGCVNIDNKIVKFQGLFIGGFEGCMLYNYGKKQYSNFEMWRKIACMKPQLWGNKIFHKRYIDIVITHAPPQGIHDKPDLCHRGFKSFYTFIKKYQPRYFIHGHIHRYNMQAPRKTQYHNTTVINTCGHQVLEINEREFVR